MAWMPILEYYTKGIWDRNTMLTKVITTTFITVTTITVIRHGCKCSAVAVAAINRWYQEAAPMQHGGDPKRQVLPPPTRQQ